MQAASPPPSASSSGCVDVSDGCAKPRKRVAWPSSDVVSSAVESPLDQWWDSQAPSFASLFFLPEEIEIARLEARVERQSGLGRRRAGRCSREEPTVPAGASAAAASVPQQPGARSRVRRATTEEVALERKQAQVEQVADAAASASPPPGICLQRGATNGFGTGSSPPNSSSSSSSSSSIRPCGVGGGVALNPTAYHMPAATGAAAAYAAAANAAAAARARAAAAASMRASANAAAAVHAYSPRAAAAAGYRPPAQGLHRSSAYGGGEPPPPSASVQSATVQSAAQQQASAARLAAMSQRVAMLQSQGVLQLPARH